MAAPIKPAAPPTTKITSVVHTLLDGLHSMSKSDNVVGDPYTLGEATIVPIHRVRVALGAGSLHGGANQDVASGESGAQGAGGVVQIEPIAVITVGRDGIPHISCVETEPNATEKLLEQLPDLVSRVSHLMSERVAPLVSRLMNRDTTKAIAAVAKNALSDEPTALLTSSSSSSSPEAATSKDDEKDS